jgi:hypothetical protein
VALLAKPLREQFQLRGFSGTVAAIDGKEHGSWDWGLGFLRCSSGLAL